MLLSLKWFLNDPNWK